MIKNRSTQSILILLTLLVCGFAGNKTPAKEKQLIVWQPSHQTDTGKDFSEAMVCNAIAEGAIKTKVKGFTDKKVWSLGRTDLHHDNAGSNTKVEHTSAIIDGKLSGYAWEVAESNKLGPIAFISIHNNGGTNKNAVWGFIHKGDKYEKLNRDLANVLITAISEASGLENRGVLTDNSTARNDYRCKSTGLLSFYSLDENVNQAPYRVLLEVGDNLVSKQLLEDPAKQQAMGKAVKLALAKWLNAHPIAR